MQNTILLRDDFREPASHRPFVFARRFFARIAGLILVAFFSNCEIAHLIPNDPGVSAGYYAAMSALFRYCAHPNQIAYSSSVDGDFEIYTMADDGSGVVQLTSNGFSEKSPSWSPTGETIAFESDMGGQPGIYLMDADGQNMRSLVADSNTNMDPMFSLDGRGIYFSSTRAGSFSIYYYELATGQIFQITSSGGLYSDFTPTVARDWDNIYVYTDRSGGQDIATVRTDGSFFTMLVVDGYSKTNPAIAPGGAFLLYVTTETGNPQIFRATADGFGSQNITNTSRTEDYPAISPDGSRIAFSSDRAVFSQFEFYIMDADGVNPVVLTNDGSSAFFPAWSCP